MRDVKSMYLVGVSMHTKYKDMYVIYAYIRIQIIVEIKTINVVPVRVLPVRGVIQWLFIPAKQESYQNPAPAVYAPYPYYLIVNRRRLLRSS